MNPSHRSSPKKKHSRTKTGHRAKRVHDQSHRQEMRKQRRELILDALERVLRERGSDATLDEISKEAKFSRVTLYQYFTSKDEMFRVCSEERGVELVQEHTLDARTRILQAARKVFGQQGFWRATMESIAKEAGVSAVTLYRHFQDKSGLIQEFLQSIRPSQALDGLQVASHESMETIISEFAAKSIQILQDNRDILRLSMLENTGEMIGLEDLRKRPGRTVDRLTEFFRKQIEMGRIKPENPRELAFCFLGMMMSFGWIVPMLEGESTDDFERIGKFLTRIFLRGISRDGVGCEGSSDTEHS